MAGKKAAQDPVGAPLSVSKVDVCRAYKTVFATQEGQIVLADLMRYFSYTRTSTFVPGDIHRTVHNEGTRTVLVHIGRMIDAEPSEFAEQTAES